MAWSSYLPVLIWCGFAGVLGLVVGSFLNVVIARLPYEKSIIWPGSHCLHCYRPVRRWDNVPVLGYLRLRGRCRHCGASFGRRYLWVELGTGLAFVALFVLEVLVNWHQIPPLRFNPWAGLSALPPAAGLAMFAYHAALLSGLIAAAVIDAEHRFIPPQLTYTLMGVGLVGGALMPWPWPQPPEAAARMPDNLPWIFMEMWGLIPPGVQPWPFWGPLPSWAPPGSWQLGLINAAVGALVGSLTVRLIRWLFSTGFGREAMGMGDADLLMMAGAFLGWQIAVVAIFAGSIVTLVMFVIQLAFGPEPTAASTAIGGAHTREVPFGPGLAVGVVLTWFGWPWIGPQVQFVFFDAYILGFTVFVISIGLLAAGLLLRRPEPVTTQTPAAPSVKRPSI